MSKAKQTKKRDCPVCKYIKNGGFPFVVDKGYWIDSEGCARNDIEGEGMIKIYFCPQCRRRLLND